MPIPSRLLFTENNLKNFEYKLQSVFAKIKGSSAASCFCMLVALALYKSA